MAEKKRYRVKRTKWINGFLYNAGDIVLLTAAQAALDLANGTIEEAKEEKAPPSPKGRKAPAAEVDG